MRSNSLNMKTYHLGLTGYPLGHSLSPVLHKAALEEAGLAGTYDLYPVLPSPEGVKDLEMLAGRMRTGNLQGLNVTIPHKQSILQFVDEFSPTVQRIGAANVIYCSGERLIAENTDVPAFKNDLRQRLLMDCPELLQGRKALVLGAGGSARAVVDALLAEAWDVRIAARKAEQAVDLCLFFKIYYPESTLAAVPLAKKSIRELDDPMLIVNATPAGMAPGMDQSPWPLECEFPAGSAVYDLIYNPIETVLIKMARSVSLPAVNGCGMLVKQAALSFSLWTGLPSSDEIMKEALDQFLGKASWEL